MRPYRKILACLLVVITYGVTLSAQEGALLYPGRNVSLNDNTIQAMSAVQSGDKIHTGDSEAQLTAKHVMALIDKDTTLHYGEELMVLECGAVVVNSSTMGVHGSDTTVRPLQGTAKFRMENRRGKLKVDVESGRISVSNDQKTVLTAGQSMERNSSDPCPVAGAYIPRADAGSLGRFKAGALIGAAGGAVAAWWFLFESRPASNSRPD